MSRKPAVSLARVYEDAAQTEGRRILVDRVWPRGLSKDRARLDEWCKDVAPSTELRKWYGHDPDKFAEFERRYRAELDRPEQRAALDGLRERIGDGPATILTASKAVEISQAAVLVRLLGG